MNNQAQATPKAADPTANWKAVKLSVKNDRTLAFTCDLSALVELQLPSKESADWYGKDGNKSLNVCNISAQKLRVAGLEDVYVDLRVYTKEQAYALRSIRAEQEQAQAEAQAKLEAVRPAAEAIAQALGITVEEAMSRLVSVK